MVNTQTRNQYDEQFTFNQHGQISTNRPSKTLPTKDKSNDLSHQSTYNSIGRFKKISEISDNLLLKPVFDIHKGNNTIANGEGPLQSMMSGDGLTLNHYINHDTYSLASHRNRHESTGISNADTINFNYTPEKKQPQNDIMILKQTQMNYIGPGSTQQLYSKK